MSFGIRRAIHAPTPQDISWWASRLLGAPMGPSGSQKRHAYAYFPRRGRLGGEVNGTSVVYDTAPPRSSGLSQQQSSRWGVLL